MTTRISQYDSGDAIILEATFADAAGVAVDPDTITFRILDPDGTETTFEYGVDAEVEKNSTGDYQMVVSLAAATPGFWRYRIESTGQYQGAEETYFEVLTSAFS